MLKRVLMVAGRMEYGGLEIMLMNFFRFIDREVVIFDFMLNYEEKGSFDDEILSLGGRIFIMPRLKFRNVFKYIMAVNRFFKEHKGEYQIVHGHLTSVGVIYLTIAKMYGVKTTVIHAHYASTKNNFKGMIERLTILPVRFCADFYFACSNKAGEFCFGKNKLKKENYRLIKNGVVVKKFLFNEEIRKLKRKELCIEDKFVMAHIGRFEKEKNHKFLIEIFKHIYEQDNNSVLLLIGNGSLMQETKNAAKDCGLENSVLFLNLRNDISEILQSADIFVLPSLYEGLPVVSAEAQAAGLKCFFADTITKEADITGNCTFLSLKDDGEIWASEILKNKNYVRENTEEKIKNAGYDIKEQALWLQDFYLKN